MEIYPFDIPADSKLRVIMDAIIFLHVMQSKEYQNNWVTTTFDDNWTTFTEIDFTNLKLHTNLKNFWIFLLQMFQDAKRATFNWHLLWKKIKQKALNTFVLSMWTY